RRRPWVAVLLSLFAPGLGQLYAGKLAGAFAASLLYIAFFPAVAWLGLRLRGGRAALFAPVAIGVFFATGVCLDAARQARRGRPILDARWKRALLYAAWFVVLSLGVDVTRAVVRGHLAQAFRLSTGSMLPVMLPGDHFVVDKRAYRSSTPARGDLVAFRSPVEPHGINVKRVIGLPGAQVRFKHREVYVNGVADGYMPSDVKFDDAVIAPGTFFLMGDDRSRSLDSRSYGAVPVDGIIGRVSHVYFSRDPETGRIRWDRMGLIPE
ncbi:MAG: signal peptidase I, partial [Deltaproteobacteria bacterium]|nr:signal peptidase I [Deltaproteobacteria bacterium]